jgi:hypothetical protein
MRNEKNQSSLALLGLTFFLCMYAPSFYLYSDYGLVASLAHASLTTIGLLVFALLSKVRTELLSAHLEWEKSEALERLKELSKPCSGGK